MGNEQSYIPGIDIVEKAIEVSDYWSQHSAAIFEQENITHLTVFIGELFVNGTLWTTQTPLEKNGKNLMIHRHPCILKYISSWQKNSKFYLAVEEVQPLSHNLQKLNTLQISVGLYSIAKSLNFLHTNASVSHNNVCISSICILKDGNWKLAGMEYLCKYNELSCDYLTKTKLCRYSKSVDLNENKLLQNELNRKDFIDVYAFGVLVCEIFNTKSESDNPLLLSFIDFCKNDMQNSDISKRPDFKTILEHEYCNQDFITINSFLMELPLKNDTEKMHFFQNLTDKLLEFDEEVVAAQLSGLLLSRMVLLNKIAQNSLLPFLLTPRVDEEEKSGLLFSENRFKEYICPKILEIFKVRDVEIRVLILTYLPKYMHTFTKDELQNMILPELLVGIKDTNDHLVSMTLKMLGNLVPILGSTTVIGGKRAKIFNDGRPTHTVKKSSRSTRQIQTDQISLCSLVTELNNINGLPERQRPDGEEGESSTEELDEDLDNWEDWELNETDAGIRTEELIQPKSNAHIPDILELDIKSQIVANEESDFNFFQDMEPVIKTTNKFVIDTKKVTADKELSSKLAVDSAGDETNAEWEEEDWN